MVGAAEGQAKEEDSGERGKQKVHINARLYNIIHCSFIRIPMIIHMYNITCLHACACVHTQGSGALLVVTTVCCYSELAIPTCTYLRRVCVRPCALPDLNKTSLPHFTSIHCTHCCTPCTYISSHHHHTTH